MIDHFDEDVENFDATEESIDFQLTSESFGELVIAPADWTIGSLYSQIGNQIELDPAFQRRNVWSRAAKSKFIESLFLGIPIPQILLSARSGHKNSFLVLDGKQRLLTLKEFLENEFQLKGLRVLGELEGKRWNDISIDPEWADRLLNETQRTAVIRNWPSEKILYEIFYRLNSGSVKLSPMELRMSLHPGEFLKFIIKWTETIGPLHELLSKKEPDARMNDVELAVRYLGFGMPELEYTGDLKKFLDDTCIELNRKFSTGADTRKLVEAKLDQMSKGIDAGLSILGKQKFCKKYVHGEFENRFNRAVFDVQVAALSNGEVRKLAGQQVDKFEHAFVHASSKPEFIKAVETTTKTAEATKARFQIFFDAIKQYLGVEIRVPNIKLPNA